MYAFARDVASFFGLDETVILFLAVVQAVTLWAICRYRTGRLPPWMRWSVWGPLLISVGTAISGWRLSRNTVYLLESTGALNPSQHQALFDMAVHGVVRKLLYGLFAAFALKMLYRYVLRPKYGPVLGAAELAPTDVTSGRVRVHD